MFKQIDLNDYQSCLKEAGLPDEAAEATAKIISEKIATFQQQTKPICWLIVPTLGMTYFLHKHLTDYLKKEIEFILKKAGIADSNAANLVAMTQK